MAVLVKSDGVPLHPREDYLATGTINTVNGVVTLETNGCSGFTIDLRGVGITGSPTVVLEGSIDGSNFETIPVQSRATQLWVATFAPGTVGGMWIGDAPGYKQVRLRMVAAPTAGAYDVTLRASNADYVALAMQQPATVFATAVGAASATVTLTLAAPGAGLFHYLTRLSMTRFAAAALSAAATPVTVTTTNLPGSLAFTLPADAALQGTVWEKEIDFSNPIRSNTANTATTVVLPATTGVIWRATAYGYVAA